MKRVIANWKPWNKGIKTVNGLETEELKAIYTIL